jgi:hypothetical protein
MADGLIHKEVLKLDFGFEKRWRYILTGELPKWGIHYTLPIGRKGHTTMTPPCMMVDST